MIIISLEKKKYGKLQPCKKVEAFDFYVLQEEKIAKTYKVQHKHDKENGVSDQATNRNGTLQDIALEETTSEQGSVAPSHEEEWRLVARILERIFLIVIFLTCVIGTTMILLKMLMLY